MTLVVIGLDAADYALAKRWDCENILQTNNDKIETFSHTKDRPITAEVWPAIANGKLPDEGGKEGKRGSDWDGLMSIASTVGKKTLPKDWQIEIGRYLRVGQEVPEHYGPVENDHAFAEGAAFNWPGITPAKNWSRAHYWYMKQHTGEITDIEFLRHEVALTGQELGWAYSMSKLELPIVATRCHILDHAGHAWCYDEEKYRETYEMVDEMIGEMFSDYPDDIVIVSDHGMQTEFTDDEDPGTHSWRSMVSTNFDSDLPEKVQDFREWVEWKMPRSGELGVWGEDTTDGATTEQLKNLGYID